MYETTTVVRRWLKGALVERRVGAQGDNFSYLPTGQEVCVDNSRIVACTSGDPTVAGWKGITIVKTLDGDYLFDAPFAEVQKIMGIGS